MLLCTRLPAFPQCFRFDFERMRMVVEAQRGFRLLGVTFNRGLALKAATTVYVLTVWLLNNGRIAPAVAEVRDDPQLVARPGAVVGLGCIAMGAAWALSRRQR